MSCLEVKIWKFWRPVKTFPAGKNSSLILGIQQIILLILVLTRQLLARSPKLLKLNHKKTLKPLWSLKIRKNPWRLLLKIKEFLYKPPTKCPQWFLTKIKVILVPLFKRNFTIDLIKQNGLKASLTKFKISV
jgi:hypothetical protein